MLFGACWCCALFGASDALLLNVTVTRVARRAVEMRIAFVPPDESRPALRFVLRAAPAVASPWMRVVVHNGTGRLQLNAGRPNGSCHYRYMSDKVVAVMNDCQNGKWV